MSIKRQALRDEVYEMILAELLGGQRPPGSRLSIDGLARQFEISPTPVREALVSLEHSGLVQYAARRGYVVAPTLSERQIRELIDTRQVVEGAALSRSFADWEAFEPDLRRAHEEHRSVVERIAEAGSPDYEMVREHFRVDWGFHRTFFQHAGNRYLTEIIESLGTHVHRMRQTWASPAESLDAREALAEHAEILNHVANRNHDAALTALRTHLDHVRDRSTATSA